MQTVLLYHSAMFRSAVHFIYLKILYEEVSQVMDHTQKNPSMPLVKHQRITKRKRMYSTLKYIAKVTKVFLYSSEMGVIT